MDEHSGEQPLPLPQKQAPEKLALRGRPRPVVRFRKGLIVALTGSLSIVIAAVTWLALDAGSLRLPEDHATADTSAHVSAEPLSGAPATYGDVPRLGPPLPGDLGRPILERQRELAGDAEMAQSPPLRGSPDEALAAEQERLRSEEHAARNSALTVSLGARPAVGQGVIAEGERPSERPTAQFEEGPGSPSYSGRVVRAVSPHVLAAGSLIPASLITGLNSELPGMVIAQVTENVRDSATGTNVLIAQGSRLIGKYESDVAYGQKRALVLWQRIIFPDGTSIALDDMPATDAAGYSGLRDRVDAHSWQLLKGVALSTLLNIGSEVRLNGGGPLVRAIREATQQSGSQAGEQLVSKTLDVRPTLTVRPGWPVRVLVSKDLVLEPWKE